MFVHPADSFRVLILRGLVLAVSDSYAFRASVGFFFRFCSVSPYVVFGQKNCAKAVWILTSFAQFVLLSALATKTVPNSTAAQKP